MSITYATTDAYLPTGLAVSLPRAAHSLGIYAAETGGTNGVTVKLQGSIDGVAWNDLLTYDDTSTIRAGVDVAITAGAGLYLFASLMAAKWALACYKYYRVLAKSTSSGNPGVASLTGPFTA